MVLRILYLDFLGLLPPGTQFDLFRGTAAMKQDIDDKYPTTLGHTIKVICKYYLLNTFVPYLAFRVEKAQNKIGWVDLQTVFWSFI